MLKKITKWETEDGKVFDTQEEAEDYMFEQEKAGMTHTKETGRTPSAAPILRAMAENYPSGHLWDAQDAKTCQLAASEIERLRADLQAARRAPVALVLQGYKLVPVTPTQEMLEAACNDGVNLNGRPVWKQSCDVQNAWRYQRMLDTAPQPAAQGMDAQSWADFEALRHSANEWADMATNGLQWLRNIVDGISDPQQALMNLESNLTHCRAVNDVPAAQRAIKAIAAALAAQAKQGGV